MDIPLTCTVSQCTGAVVVVDSLRGTGQQSFTVSRTTDTLAPFPLNLLQDRQELAASQTHSLMIRNGEVWSFGWNREGQLGLGGKDANFHPMLRKIPGLSRIVAVAAGIEFSVALDSAGEVWTWGSDFLGALGNGNFDPNEAVPSIYGNPRIYNTFFSDPRPRRALSAKKIVSIATGPYHVIVADSAGKTWGWGYNPYGALGFVSPAGKVSSPTQAGSTARIRKVVAGGDQTNWESYRSFSIALDYDGKIWGMGMPSHWQFGSLTDASTAPTEIPINLSNQPSLSGATGLLAGVSAFLIEEMRISDKQRLVFALGYVWGTYWSSYPKGHALGEINMQSLGGSIAVEIGSESSIPNGNNEVWWKGRTVSGPSGAVTDWASVRKSDGGVLVGKNIRAGANHAIALDLSGNMYCWGDAGVCTGGSGWNSNAVRIERDSSPAVPPGVITIQTNFSGIVLPSNIRVIPVQYRFDSGMVRTSDVTLTCSATSCTGTLQVADAKGVAQKQFTIARSIDSLGAFPLSLLQDRQELATSRSHTLMVRDGEVWAFGNNQQGQLGIKYKDSLFHAALRKVPGLSHIVSVAVGLEFSVALDSAGDVWTWGSNFLGALGNGQFDPNEAVPNIYVDHRVYNSYYSDPIPRRVLTGKKVVSIAAGPYHVIVADSAGSTWGWGHNSNGLLGFVSAVGKVSSPTPSISPIRIRKVVAGGDQLSWEWYRSFSIGLDYNGKVWGMGKPSHWQFGSLTDASNAPTEIPINLSNQPSLSGVTGIVSGVSAFLVEASRANDDQRVVFALGYDWGAYWSALPTGHALGSITMQSLGGSIAVQIATESSVPIGEYDVWWKGRTVSGPAGPVTDWKQVQKLEGGVLTGRSIRAGVNHAVVVDSSQNLYCWGEAKVCSGASDGIYTQVAAKVLVDSALSPELVIEGLVDTILVPSDKEYLDLTVKVGAETYLVHAKLNCVGDVCQSDVFVKLPDGRIVGKTIRVRKASCLYNQISFDRNEFSPTDLLTGKIISPFKGAVALNISELGGSANIANGLIDLGVKSTDTLRFSIPLSRFGGGLSGVYFGQVSMTGLGWNESTVLRSSRDSMISPEMGSRSWVIDGSQEFVFLGSDTLVLLAERCKKITDSICGKYSKSALVKKGDVVRLGNVDLGTKAIENDSDQLVWRTWPTGAFFKCTGLGIVSNLSVSVDYQMVLYREVAGVEWNQFVAVDSSKIILQDANGLQLRSINVSNTVGHKSLNLQLPNRPNGPDWAVLRLLVWKSGFETEYVQTLRFGG